MARKQCILICPRSVNMARKHCFLLINFSNFRKHSLRKQRFHEHAALRFFLTPSILFRAEKSEIPGSSHAQNGVVENNISGSSQDSERLSKMVNELQSLLKQRKDALDKVENEKDLLEKENVLKDTEIKVGIHSPNLLCFSRQMSRRFSSGNSGCVIL